MHEECLICGAALEYLDRDEELVCARCGKTQRSKTRCVNGHFVCDECHTGSTDEITEVCLGSASADPVEILEQLMALPSCHMHGPEHHIMVGAALLTAYKNAGGALDLKAALAEMRERGAQVPGGACGLWGACGAGISAGIYVSILLKATPLAKEAWGCANRMTARALEKIGKHGGPRCCKRDSYLAVLAAAEFTRECLGVALQPGPIRCSRWHQNNQCLKEDCPFHSAGAEK